jgi:hypothetical protein
MNSCWTRQQIGQGLVVYQTGWETVIENNKQAFTAEFVPRSRCTSAYPISLTPAAFVDTPFANAASRHQRVTVRTAINELGAVTDTSNVAGRSRALRDVAENSTLAQQEFNRALVLMQYFGYLRRNPIDPPEPHSTFRAILADEAQPVQRQFRRGGNG